MQRFLGILVALVAVSSPLRAQETPPIPTSHTQRDIEGWTIHIDDRLLAGADKELGDHALRILANRLYDIKHVVPADKVARLQKIPIWLDKTHGKLRPAQYHPSAGWLKANGYSPALAKCVHIPVAVDFCSKNHQRVQPWSVMHELAHAYHDQVLGFDHAEIQGAWARWRESGKYKNILHINGRKTAHYGLTDPKEFFAEMTESFFGQNDFFPFNRAELQQEEPEVFALLTKIWSPAQKSGTQPPGDKGIGPKKVQKDPPPPDEKEKKFRVTPGHQTRAQAPYADWKHSGSLYILTTPEGANLPASALEKDFPLLVRLHKDFFTFNQAKANGDDLRFASSNGTPLAYQIDEWDLAQGQASMWVRVPQIKGNDRQEIKLFWGKADAVSESNGKAVFNGSNGYLSVWHMTDPARDDVGTLAAKDQGTTPTPGIIGTARRFALGKGIACGDNIATYPAGADSHTSEAWFRAEKPNGRVLAWGMEKAQGKVVMQVASPPHIRMECYFSGADVAGKSTLPMSDWVHVVHTYKKGESRVYVNGQLDGVTTTPNAPLNIPTPAKMWIGGWYNNYNFVGDIDEVRISKGIRSADWIKLQYENQKPLQTLVGSLVQPGDRFSVSQSALTVPEGKQATITAEAGGAQKVYWILKRDGQETVAAVDRLSFTFGAGRVVGDKSLLLQCKAIYPQDVKTKDIAITIKENIPEPVFTLKAPSKWDGRETIEIIPQIMNTKELLAQGADKLNYTWTVSNLATIKDIVPGKLLLKRAQNSGKLTVAVSIDNGGQPSVQTTTLEVAEPKREAWVQRPPAKEEKPEDNQFYARDDKNEGTLHYQGTLPEIADAVFLKVTADDQPFKSLSAKLPADKAYAFTVKLKPGLIKYKVEFGSRTGARETVHHTANNIVCGDAYLIQGQSNAEATDVGKDDPPFTSDWIRSYGSTSGSPDGAGLKHWGNAVCRDRKGGKAQIGYWGLELAKRLVENHKMPICIINGAVGGSRIDQHQRNPSNPEDVATIYGRALWRVRQARLTHGIRGVLWHQGENDQGADGPTGRYGWVTYQDYFVDLTAAWKQDFPNIQHYYMFQIWPRACAMGIHGSDNHLREVQRKLPSLFSNLRIMSTLGIKPPGGCHFPPAGYAEFARLMSPLVEQENYGKAFNAVITPPDLLAAHATGAKNDEIVLEFDQPMAWKDAVAQHFHVDGVKGKVISGSATGRFITLKLAASGTPRHITYLDSQSWNQDHLLWGENGIAALTFCEVPILARKQNP